ncbi:hypothetical protein SF1_19170 [Sphingobacterium faecium NBRC 15299]|uniref:hypothetical protein n=1 Tax=Sphingobacterium faecium TaxID=34087 RepID=UPI000D33CF08|nr:hypothetical protein [Sphingobacterium faecium]PTX09438.1 hypothetical protein C8N37_10666 [Sphingobacterium faecium]GEM63935.1 hypothetical protein SF1_19170 [Sphingobacterium faecium NBRC 15299]
MYNPFVRFTEEILSSLQQEGKHFLVLQRFEWPRLSRSTTFLVTPYVDIERAKDHEQNLKEKEGKLLDISKDVDKLLGLIKKGTGYHLFLDRFKETNWNKRMLKEYERNIVNYLRSKTAFTRQDSIDINFTLKFGRLIAEVRAKDKSLDVTAFELIK